MSSLKKANQSLHCNSNRSADIHVPFRICIVFNKESSNRTEEDVGGLEVPSPLSLLNSPLCEMSLFVGKWSNSAKKNSSRAKSLPGSEKFFMEIEIACKYVLKYYWEESLKWQQMLCVKSHFLYNSWKFQILKIKGQHVSRGKFPGFILVSTLEECLHNWTELWNF